MKKTFIIFLDIDGVLNCQLFFRERAAYVYDKINDPELESLEFYSQHLCKDRIGWLNTLCEETGAVVVISSSWRKGKTIERLREILNYAGATFTIIDKTGHTGYERGTEISKWIKDNVTPETHGSKYYDFDTYAIIDDDSDMLLNQQHNFFQTDGYSGLTPNTCYRINRFFTSKMFNSTSSDEKTN